MSLRAFLLILFHLLLYSASSAICQEVTDLNTSSNAEKVDSLLSIKFEYLDRIMQSTNSYRLDENSNIDSLVAIGEKESEIIQFFIGLTSIKPDMICIYACDYQLNGDVIRKWKKWTERNRSRLLYEKSGQLVFTELYPSKN